MLDYLGPDRQGALVFKAQLRSTEEIRHATLLPLACHRRSLPAGQLPPRRGGTRAHAAAKTQEVRALRARGRRGRARRRSGQDSGHVGKGNPKIPTSFKQAWPQSHSTALTR